MFLVPSNCPKCGSKHINTRVSPSGRCIEKDKYLCTECKTTYNADEADKLRQVWSGCDNLIEEYKRINKHALVRTGWKCDNYSEKDLNNPDGIFDCRLCKNYKYNHHQAMTGEIKKFIRSEVNGNISSNDTAKYKI